MLSPTCLIWLWLPAVDPCEDGVFDFTQVTERFNAGSLAWSKRERDGELKVILALGDVWSVLNTSEQF